MKKYSLLFFTLSSFAFAGTSVLPGDNINKTNTLESTSATINVNVTANVIANSTQLVIIDEEGTEISALNFEHNLVQSGSALTGDRALSQTIYAKATGINERNLEHTSLNDYVLENSSNPSETISGSFAITSGTANNNVVPYTLSSNITSDTMAGEGTYSTNTQTFTITFNKSKN
ncbi:hypothetical protein [Cetobacterium sp.]|uniref:hypothetical protein n=1 Tax=Cetobacterium sp. TaxID=2071632 RepID=UPI003AEF266F